MNNNENTATAVRQSKEVFTSPVYEETDYSKFHFIGGNRPTDQGHINRLIQELSESGNFTQLNPILCTPDLGIADGQHTFVALQQLKWPVFYRIATGLTLDIIRKLNSGHKNWSWRDYGYSLMQETKPDTDGLKTVFVRPHYRYFMELVGDYNLGLTTMLQYTQGHFKKGDTVDFAKGDMPAFDVPKARSYLDKLMDIRDVCNIRENDFNRAVYEIITDPTYDHSGFLKALEIHKNKLLTCYSYDSYLRLLWELYGIRPR